MSEENVELAYRAYDAFSRRDWDAFLALMDDEVEVESRLVAMEGGYHGHEGLRRWWNDFLGTFPDYTIEIEELRDLGDVTLGHIRGWGRGAGSDNACRRSVLAADQMAGRKSAVAQLFDGGGGSRSRRAAAVGDVGGERRAGPARV